MALADSAGLPLAITLAPGNRHDCTLVEQTLDEALVAQLPRKLIADKGFDSRPLQERLLEEREIELIAPTRGGIRPSRRKQDGRSLRRYCRRWKVECLFAWLKQFRRINTRWDRYAANFLGFVHLGCMIILLRQF